MEQSETKEHVFQIHRYRAKRIGMLALALVCALLSVVIFAYNFGLGARNQQVAVQYVQPEQAAADVLLVMSYDESEVGTPLARDGVLDVMGRSSVAVDVVYMDAYNAPLGSDAYNAWVSQVTQKVAQHGQYDAIIAADDDALYFVEYNHDKLFQSTPVVFFGVNDYNHALHATSSGYMTGMVEQNYVGSVMQAVTKLHPDATGFLVIVDQTPAGIGNRSQFDLAMRSFEGMDVHYLDASYLTRDELTAAVAGAEAGNIVFLLDANNDLNGNVYTLEDSVAAITNASNTPVYRAAMGGVGNGIAGSGYHDAEEEGRKAAEITITVLNGARPADIPLSLDGDLGYVFDHKVLNDYGLSSIGLPAGSAVINRQILSVDTLILLALPVALLVLALLFFRTAHRAAQREAVSAAAVQTTASTLVDKPLPTANTRPAIEAQPIAHHEEADQSPQEEDKTDCTGSSADSTIEADEAKTNGTIKNVAIHKATPRDVIRKDTSAKRSGRRNGSTRRVHGSNGSEVRSLVGIEVINYGDIVDLYGSKAGEETLRVIRKRLEGVENTAFIRAREHGFLVGLENEVVRSSPEIEFVDFVLRQPLSIEDNVITLKTCVGAMNRQRNMNAEEMEEGVDFAIEQAKELGFVNSVIFYDSNMQRAMEERSRITALLEDAIAKEDFSVFYQPQIDLRDNDVSGYEALVRLKDKEYPPAQFIPVAEMTGLIVDIDRIVTKRSIEQLSKWKRRNKRIRPISINFSAVHLIKDDDYVDFLLDLLQVHDIPPAYIRIEITEALFTADQKKAEAFLTRLFQAGITIALDRFGRGFTSFSDIMTVPASIVKIDKEFVDTFLVDGNDKNFEQLVLLAQGFGKRVVVVGVDQKWQLEVCRNLNCDAVQGYYFSKPLLPENAVQYKPQQ